MVTQTVAIRPLTLNLQEFLMDAKLLELLVCPVTKGPLRYDRDNQELISQSAQLAYPVRDGIPVLLESEARSLNDAGYDSDAEDDYERERDDDFQDSYPHKEN